MVPGNLKLDCSITNAELWEDNVDNVVTRLKKDVEWYLVT